MRKSALALAALAALSAAAPAGAATTLFSTDFESGTFLPFTATGRVGVNTGQDYVTCCGATGSQGSQDNHFASFGSGNVASGTLESPVFNLVVGETYTLDFLFGEWSAGQSQETFTVDIGALTFTFSQSPTSNLDAVFGVTQIQFIAQTGGPATIRFHSSGVENVDSFIDNVVFSTTAAVDSAVPEPSTWAMMLLGFGAIGFALRRQKVAALA